MRFCQTKLQEEYCKKDGTSVAGKQTQISNVILISTVPVFVRFQAQIWRAMIQCSKVAVNGPSFARRF